jgi:hypothetical protein
MDSMTLAYAQQEKQFTLSRATVTQTRVWIGNWIYWILTGRNYNYKATADLHNLQVLTDL